VTRLDFPGLAFAASSVRRMPPFSDFPRKSCTRKPSFDFPLRLSCSPLTSLPSLLCGIAEKGAILKRKNGDGQTGSIHRNRINCFA
jgi:hypothetical protein